MNPPAGDSRPRVTWRAVDDHWSGWVVFAVVLVAMLAFTWRTWPDPIIDFGRELYVPWRLSEGQHLYTEIAYHNGPLSAHVNAWWFGGFGVSMTSLFTLNLLVVLAVLGLLRSLLREVTSCGGATLGGVVFLVLFAFGDYVGVSNYNWMSPYSHEMTHGIALALLSIWFARGVAGGGRTWCAFAAGVAVGLLFLTKAEVFIAGAGGTVVALLVALRVRYEGLASKCRIMAVATIGGMLPPLIALWALSTYADFPIAVGGTLGTWLYVFDGSLGDQDFFLRTSGFDDVSGNAWRFAMAAGGWLVVLLPIAVVARLVPARLVPARLVPARRRVPVTAVLGAAVVALALWIGSDLPIYEWLRPLPAVLLIMLIAWGGGDGLAMWRRGTAEPEPIKAQELSTSLALLVFSGLLLAKVALNVQVSHYGFGLAMPGTVLACACLFGPAAAAVARRGGSAGVFRALVTAVVGGLAICHLALIGDQVAKKVHRVGSGGDAFFAGNAGTFVAGAVDWIAKNTARDSTMTVMIDCEMLNYLARRRNPIRFGNFNPQQLHLFGESTIRDRLEASPPDVIAFVHRDTSEYGPRFFGQDYGRELFRWVMQNYAAVQPPLGAVPFKGVQGGIMFFRHKK